MGKTSEMEEADIVVGLGESEDEIIVVVRGLVALHLSADKAADLATQLMNGVHAIERRESSGFHAKSV